jgi:hypothetical protein
LYDADIILQPQGKSMPAMLYLDIDDVCDNVFTKMSKLYSETKKSIFVGDVSSTGLQNIRNLDFYKLLQDNSVPSTNLVPVIIENERVNQHIVQFNEAHGCKIVIYKCSNFHWEFSFIS